MVLLKQKLNQWTHIAWVRSLGTMKTYVNGQLGGTTNHYKLQRVQNIIG